MASKKPRRPEPGKPRSQRGHSTRRQAPRDPNDIRFIAAHKAGHAVSAVVLGFPIPRGVTIRPRRLPGGEISLGWTGTHTLIYKEVAGRGEAVARPHIARCLTGPLAELRINPAMIGEGGHRLDGNEAREIAIVALCTPEDVGGGQLLISPAEQGRNRKAIDDLIETCVSEAEILVATHLKAIERVAASLIERESLTEDEVVEVVRIHQ